ncbi:cyclin-dependent protein kinase inhibitor SMR6-like [Rutidosis leptorrhynchoides]|uniref:cyclin-dependent protein kinase inhibitor SMR6-like n=1 Tax=Rutidosis leptorrhynchoides TaxID=125765 RepID=UPI003A9A4FF0
MGFSKKHDGESLEGKKWVIAGITMRAPLKSLSTKKVREDDGGNLNSGSTTPTSKGSKIPEVLPCPPPPRKRRPVTACHHNGNHREFFTSPELDSLFSLLSKAN